MFRRPAVVRAVSCALVALALSGAAAASTAAAPTIHAHRGGPFIWGKATFAEAALPTYVAAAKAGDILEIDVQLSADGVALALHDDTLDRVTPCTGPVAARTAANIRRFCKVDVLGSPGSSLRGRGSDVLHTVPTIAEVLAVARRYSSEVNIEVKQPDEAGAITRATAIALAESGIPLERVLVQSFFPANVQAASALMPGVTTSMLARRPDVPTSIETALLVGASWVAPRWPVDAAYVQAAHAAGLRVAPYTLNSYAEVQAARDAGVDAIISDDPVMARWALRR